MYEEEGKVLISKKGEAHIMSHHIIIVHTQGKEKCCLFYSDARTRCTSRLLLQPYSRARRWTRARKPCSLTCALLDPFVVLLAFIHVCRLGCTTRVQLCHRGICNEVLGLFYNFSRPFRTPDYCCVELFKLFFARLRRDNSRFA